MDPVRFDTLARTLATTGTRRRLLRLLAAVPVAGAVLSLFDEVGVAGNGNKGGKGKNGKNGRGANGGKGGKGKSRSRDGKDGKSGHRVVCQAEPKTTTCKNTCGTVMNRCGTRVNCGPCTCGSGCHPVCQECNPVTDTCDAINAGGECGNPGQVCQADGSCACTPGGTTCPKCHSCVGGVCTRLPNGTVCGMQSQRHYGATPGAIRCCDGDCPDPDCYPSGSNNVTCEFNNAACAGVNCCSQESLGCATGIVCYCAFPGANEPCGSDHDCEFEGEATACICGKCQPPP